VAVIPAGPENARPWTLCFGGWSGKASRAGQAEASEPADQKDLPSPFTVQGGGSDLIFPHHEMGSGHAYSLAGVPLAKHYAHAGMVGLDGEKMSKSKGNLVLVSKLRAAGEDPAAVRLGILAHHYRSDWSWTDEGFEEAKTTLITWRRALEHAPEGSAGPLLDEMRSALAADLNAPAAVAAVSRWAKQANADGGRASSADRALVKDAVDALLGVLL
jgi:L-cysteine:1D-myo-inositol 2-amino-2-deoxy-alpha-D-glucopyranoside ligase